ncbi:hypothetical protein [Williamsia maris]|uniref:Type III secretion system (T3SS) SseB-like protein n=1 Tax=Williamsia maris TaxID=72806 RepID=A0ABT1H946_9NOCA|nr:hypothetical protein [Williamsia maris]MCP2174779.1 hypothetical protein [Williamsia maris]
MSWQPGDLTAAQMQDEWVEENGWAAQPPAAIIALWRQIADAEVAYGREQTVQVADTTPTVGAELPDLVVVPAHPRLDGTQGFDIELAVSGGNPMVVAFSTVDALAAMLGEFQPWVGLTPRDIASVHAGLPILLDPTPGVLDAEWTADRLTALKEAIAND